MTNTTTVLFQFDFNNPVHAQLFANVVGAGIPMQLIGTGVQTPVTTQESTPEPTQVSKPVAETKTYAPAEDVLCTWDVDKTKVTYTLADGKYAGQSGVRKTLNARLRNAGAIWDADKKAWKFASSKKANEFVRADMAQYCDRKDVLAVDPTVALYPTVVTAAEIEAVRAKAQARAEKKAQKA